MADDPVNSIPIIDADKVELLTGHSYNGLWPDLKGAKADLRARKNKSLQNALDYVIFIRFPGSKKRVPGFEGDEYMVWITDNVPADDNDVNQWETVTGIHIKGPEG